jgi:hypothetical protein
MRALWLVPLAIAALPASAHTPGAPPAGTPGAPLVGTPGAPPRQTPGAPGAVVIAGFGSSQLLPIDHSGSLLPPMPPIPPWSGLAPRLPIGGGVGFSSPGIPASPPVLNNGQPPFGKGLPLPIPGTAPPMPGTNPFTGMPELPAFPGR